MKFVSEHIKYVIFFLFCTAYIKAVYFREIDKWNMELSILSSVLGIQMAKKIHVSRMQHFFCLFLIFFFEIFNCVDILGQGDSGGPLQV